jgi:hypothetical protein
VSQPPADRDQPDKTHTEQEPNLMSTTLRRTLIIVAAVAVVGLGAHFLIRALVAMHS